MDADHSHKDYFLVTKSFGVTLSWLRRWRYRLLLHRASYVGEANLIRMMHGPNILHNLRLNLSSAWVRHIVWKRAQDADPVHREAIQARLLTDSVEELIASAWHWYEPMMASRRSQQLRLVGDRDDILAIDGNAKLHRRTCGMPFAEVADQPTLGKRLLRGCSCRPHGKGTLCQKHAFALQPSSSAAGTHILKHKLRRALHGNDDVTHLEVMLKGFRARWQPACTIDAGTLASYFAQGADARIQARRRRRFKLRSKGVRGKRGRKEQSFMASWSSLGPRASSECSTHKETEAHIAAAARTAGFLTAVSASGIVFELGELIGAESLSQRYCFLAKVASRLPSLKIVVHDDACHLRLIAEGNGQGNPMAARLASDMSFIVDEYHSSGHVGQWCARTCMPQLAENQALLRGFPTNICETVNSELSPLGHTVHHMGRWVCQLAVREMVDVLNMKTVMQARAKWANYEKRARNSQKRRRVS